MNFQNVHLVNYHKLWIWHVSTLKWMIYLNILKYLIILAYTTDVIDDSFTIIIAHITMIGIFWQYLWQEGSYCLQRRLRSSPLQAYLRRQLLLPEARRELLAVSCHIIRLLGIINHGDNQQHDCLDYWLSEFLIIQSWWLRMITWESWYLMVFDSHWPFL